MKIFYLLKKVDGQKLWAAGNFSNQELDDLLADGYEPKGFESNKYVEGKR